LTAKPHHAIKLVVAVSTCALLLIPLPLVLLLLLLLLVLAFLACLLLLLPLLVLLLMLLVLLPQLFPCRLCSCPAGPANQSAQQVGHHVDTQTDEDLQPIEGTPTVVVTKAGTRMQAHAMRPFIWTMPNMHQRPLLYQRLNVCCLLSVAVLHTDAMIFMQHEVVKPAVTLL
jgi:hypothetical protein